VVGGIKREEMVGATGFETGQCKKATKEKKLVTV